MSNCLISVSDLFRNSYHHRVDIKLLVTNLRMAYNCKWKRKAKKRFEYTEG